jgi:hypothetical protein
VLSAVQNEMINCWMLRYKISGDLVTMDTLYCFIAVSLCSAAQEMWPIFCLLHNDNTDTDVILPEYKKRSLLLQVFTSYFVLFIALPFFCEQHVACVYELMIIK